MHFGASVIEFAGCQRVVLDAPLSPVQSRALTCAAGCQRVILDAPLSRVQSRPISRGRHVDARRASVTHTREASPFEHIAIQKNGSRFAGS